MRTILSRLLLVGLLVVAVVAVIMGTSGGGAVVSLDSLDPDDVSHDAFSIESRGTFAINAAGSFEEAGSPMSDTTMAAYGWIVRRDAGAVVWRMRPSRPERGTLVTVRDTVTFEPGTYDVYFASHGDPLVRAPGPRDASLGERIRAILSRGGRAWVGDAGRWRLRLAALDEGARAARSASPRDPAEDDSELRAGDSSLVWQARGVRDRQRRETILQVTDDAPVRLRAVTEISDGVVADRASLVRLGTSDTVWVADAAGSVWAGGSLKNQIVEDEVTLGPGLYRVAYEADRSHAYRDWTANPPLVPADWGMTVRRGAPGAAIGLLDVTSLDLPTIAAFECVGPDEELEAAFTLPTATDVLLVAVGEISSGSAYDFATLERQEGDGDWNEVWEMEDGLEPAGGASKNKRAVVALRLDAGTYRLLYETDGSHDCVSGYNSDGPPDGDLWGAALYALDPTLDVSTISVVVTDLRADDVPASVALDLPNASRLIARIDSVGDDEDHRARFVLDVPTTVTIAAAGEMSSDSRYDYATIERPDGTLVWDMSWANTRAGGDDSSYHRVFSGTLDLPAGAYVVRYRSDGSRSFGDFGPTSRVLWGVRVYGPPTAPDPDITPPESPEAPAPIPAPPPPEPPTSTENA